ncbi:hypothetical protein OPV22_019497 [Ensete ventricosum]|uniref:Mitochondrial import inner membrane translocase subunit n=1 Tax=Ensete ventricosum TaxID=4639 RepID=A0AAV8QDZ0_ENSVE|nr:hypothetical protein OPV22_019497 [Ensete ventricosum]
MDNSPELQRFLEQEKHKAMISEMVGKLTNECWDKCITGAPGSKFSSSESACLTNCAQRCIITFLEALEVIGFRS